ncbi:MAG: 50S ribosomal protein L4 [bacterium]|jgi:large subunit ribosomal protein L4
MSKLQTLNLEQASVGEIELDDSIVETPYHPQAVKDTVVQFLAAKRQGSHSTKDRGEVSYSTRKLYRQKGTGNARAGSAKSPIRRHGGTTFGPKPRDYSFKLNKKVRSLALRALFAEKLRQDQVMILESLELPDHKTKNFRAMLDQWGVQKALIVVDEPPTNLVRAARNLPDVHVVSHRSLNVYEMMRFPKVIFVKSALEALKERLSK